jgi:non-ribosomal peptide synthetase component E (peptide arylation enzyme)
MLGMEVIVEVAVVAEADPRLGEHAAAVVRVRQGMAPPTIQQVRDHLAGAGLTRQKWPESIHQVGQFPRTASGKVQKFRLRELLAAGELGSGAIENLILQQ